MIVQIHTQSDSWYKNSAKVRSVESRERLESISHKAQILFEKHLFLYISQSDSILNFKKFFKKFQEKAWMNEEEEEEDL